MASVAAALRLARPAAMRIAARSTPMAVRAPVRSFTTSRLRLAKKYTKDHEWIDLSADRKSGVIGIARPAALNPALPSNTIFNKEVSDNDAKLYAKSIPAGWLSQLLGMRAINGAAETVWYMKEIHKMLLQSKL
ncbi:hypothetical protein NQ176_g5500 [Zarea fungicola]|uniref:Uncharacterized protein n=1 Tax=Zarea fungicola TaxID=93591 RepID=A0ACC1N968_9HYPO|nr:hypothetical protein NQ176_g5500 [Lecanicillium fungicola]